jgi:hypothetical protein
VDIDRFIVLIGRGLVAVASILGTMAIRGGERIKTWQQGRMQGRPQTAPGQPARPSAGVPANAMPARQHVGMLAVSPAPVVSMATPAVPLAPISETSISTSAPPTTPENPPDELDWAGSLSHAAVASLHLGQVLAMVRAGWLIPDESRLADVSAALDAMEAFQDRTASAIAPVLDAMTDEQRAEFFEDFGADFPPELPGLDETP